MTFFVSDESHLGVPWSLFDGDIRTHMFHGFKSNIVDPVTCCIDSCVLHAQHRGVYADLGHGQGGFSWTVAEIAAKENVWPDTISTDLHSGNTDIVCVNLNYAGILLMCFLQEM